MTQLTQPDGQTVDFPTTSWTVATVITCSLQVPIDGVTSVEVQRANGALEDPLSNADLVDPGRYQDPNSPEALPIISANGDSGQSYYNRPLRGPGDTNADSVTIDGPITILVWVNTQPLVVTVAKHSVPGSKAVKLSATVRTSDGVTVPTSSLKWQWTFQDDNTTSHQASPRHTSTEASYNVTVQVTDTSLGAAGTATILVTTPNKPAKSNHNQAGGHKHTNSKTPTGKDNGGSNDKPGSGYSSGASNPTTQPSSPTTTSTPSAPPTTTSTAPAAPPATTSATIPATTPTATTPKPTPPRPRRTKPQNTPPTAAGPLVKGKLIADVTPLPESSSPLVRATASATPAPTVRQATSVTTSPLAAIAAGLAVAALLGLGAWYEARGRRRSRRTH